MMKNKFSISRMGGKGDDRKKKCHKEIMQETREEERWSVEDGKSKNNKILNMDGLERWWN